MVSHGSWEEENTRKTIQNNDANDCPEDCGHRVNVVGVFVLFRRDLPRCAGRLGFESALPALFERIAGAF